MLSDLATFRFDTPRASSDSTCTSAGNRHWSSSGLLPRSMQDGFDGVAGQPPCANICTQLSGSMLGREYRPVRTYLAHRLVRVGRGEQSRAGSNRSTGQATVVAGPVESLMVSDGDRGDAGQGGHPCSTRSV